MRLGVQEFSGGEPGSGFGVKSQDPNAPSAASAPLGGGADSTRQRPGGGQGLLGRHTTTEGLGALRHEAPL